MVKDSVCGKIAAHQPMTRYLLPCSCSRRIPVAAGQAGGAVRCPACGAECVVPRLGELARYETAVQEPGPARTWSGAQACILAGLVTAVGGAAIAGWLHARRTDVGPFHEQAFRDAVASAPADEVHESWLMFQRQGIARPPVTEELRRLARAQALRALETAGWIAAAAGGATALIGIAAGRSPARPARPA